MAFPGELILSRLRQEVRPAATVGGYRPDIDGLRALAIIPVVLYHVGLHALRGGFIGVDVFFVISGFLITRMLHQELQQGTLQLLRFYERRVRRLAPALLTVLLCVFVLGLLYGLPFELVDHAKALAASLLSLSNVYFWLTSGYFDRPTLLNPLLHVWSLAVEEQFYLFWPLLLIALHRLKPSGLLAVTAAQVAASFLLCVAGSALFPRANFYLPFSRAWELGLGALVALLPTITLSAGPRNLLSAGGLLAILAAILLINPELPYPGVLTLAPCLGAALILLAGRAGDTLVSRILSVRPLVFLGLISYSLYLWHWPLTVFQRSNGLLVSGLSDALTKLTLVGVSTVLAALSWAFIEQPVRTSPLRPTGPQLFKGTLAAGTILLALSLAAWATGGFPARFTPQERAIAAFVQYDEHHNIGRLGDCFLLGVPGERHDFAPECLRLSPTQPNYLLLGDSHAAELWLGLSRAYPEAHFLEAASSDCYPTVVHALAESVSCVRLMDEMLKGFVPREQARLNGVLLVARWRSSGLEAVGATLRWLKSQHIPVTLLGPTAVFDVPVPRLQIAALRKGDPGLLARHLDPSTASLDAQLASLAQAQTVPYHSLLQLQCAIPSCTIQPSPVPLVWDQEHYTAEGSILMAQGLKAAGMR